MSWLQMLDVVVPDVLYVSNALAQQVLTPEHVRGVPDLAIEVGSKITRKRDETIKRRLYERFGVLDRRSRNRGHPESTGAARMVSAVRWS